MKSLTLFFSLFLLAHLGFSQELNCRVIVDLEPVKAKNENIFQGSVTEDLVKDMEQEIFNFMNARRWTEDDFNPEERIKCNLQISVTDINTSSNTFKCTAQILSTRPVYGSDYESVMLNFLDKDFTFVYQESQPMDFNVNIYSTNLTSLLGYYGYLILGMDYDSFGEMGGTEYINKARDVANAAISSGYPGWEAKTADPNGRAWIVDHLTNPQFTNFRKGLYTYHRIGMDQLGAKPVESQQQILAVLEEIKKIQAVVSRSVLLNTFFKAKKDELVKIYQGANDEEKQKAYGLLLKVDPMNSQTYDEIKKI